MCGVILMIGLLVVALLWSLGEQRRPQEGFQAVSRRGVAFDPNWKAPWAPALGPEELFGAPAPNALAWSKETLPAAMPVSQDPL